MAAGMTMGLNITEYSPKKVKQSVTGNGNAAKEQVAQVYVEIITCHGKRKPRPVLPEVALLPMDDDKNDLPE